LAFGESIEITGELKLKDLYDENFLMSILESIHDAVVVVDASGTIVYANPAYTRALGVKVGKVIGKKVTEIAPEAVTIKVLQTGRSILEQPSRVLKLGIDIVASCNPIYKNGILAGVASIFKNVTEIKKLNEELSRIKSYASYLQEELDRRTTLPAEFKAIVGKSGNFLEALARAAKASRSDVTVMLRGETGTGKELLAKAIYGASRRKNGPFIRVNCAAIPESLLESELFGFEEGSFTGARRGGKPGKFELANKGTLFLDEIGDMSLAMQAKLLRAIQEKEIERIGGTRSIQTDVRIIAATNQDLEQKVKEKGFREDLFYRLNVFGICIPPIRERREDIPLLVDHFLNIFAEREKKSMRVSQEVLRLFIKYDWPGNIRELQNVVEYAVVFCDNKYIGINDLPDYFTNLTEQEKTNNYANVNNKTYRLETLISNLEKQTIMQAIKHTSGNKTKAIKMLGISRYAFYEKLMKYGIK
jgi:PAS domain S-box-containing protein